MRLGELAEKLKLLEEVKHKAAEANYKLEQMKINEPAKGFPKYSDLEIELQVERCDSLDRRLNELLSIETGNEGIPF